MTEPKEMTPEALVKLVPGVWRSVPDYPSYAVSIYGDVISFVTGRLIYQRSGNRGGHRAVQLWKDGESKVKGVHRLVAQAFIGTIPPGKMVAHIDGNPLNNNVGNLVFATAKENQAHRLIHGTHGRGSQNSQSILSELDVRYIRTEPKRWGVNASLARRYGVSPATISAVLSGKNWSHVK